MLDSQMLKPDPDYCRNWFNTEVTKWILEQLRITHQLAIETLSDTLESTPENDMRVIYKLQGAAFQVAEIVSMIEELGNDSI